MASNLYRLLAQRVGNGYEKVSCVYNANSRRTERAQRAPWDWLGPVRVVFRGTTGRPRFFTNLGLAELAHQTSPKRQLTLFEVALFGDSITLRSCIQGVRALASRRLSFAIPPEVFSH